MSDWMANEDKVAFWAMPSAVQEEIIERADGKPDGNLQYYSYMDKKWKGTNTYPECSRGTTYRIKEKTDYTGTWTGATTEFFYDWVYGTDPAQQEVVLEISIKDLEKEHGCKVKITK